MRVLQNESLKKLNTFHINSKAKFLYIPECEEELSELLNHLQNQEYYILSGGSNILLNDQKEYESIIYMAEIDKTIKKLDEDGKFYIGASNRVQKVINEINEYGFGGIEQLYSLPAMIGGIIYMNAGIGEGKKSLFTISDYIDSVKVLNKSNKKIEWLDKRDCLFDHRQSVFQNDEYIILGAKFNFIRQDKEISKRIIQHRINSFSRKAEMGKGTFGTVFSECDRRLLKLVSFIYGKRGNIHFGNKNKNWLVNYGDGTYNDALYLINKVQKVHRLLGKSIKCEVIIWSDDKDEK